MAIRNGNSNSNFLFGTFGSDEMNGRGGNDIMFGWFGDDLMRGGNGNDLMFGGSGNDRMRGGNGDDLMFGGSGNDRVFGGNGNDLAFGGSGNDRLVGGRGSDTMFGGSGNDTFVYRADRNVGETDFYSGGSGNDRLVIRLNEDEAANEDIQADIAAFEAFIAEGGGGNFTFESLGLTVNSIERLRVIAPEPEPNENTAPVTSDVDLGESPEDTTKILLDAQLLANAVDAEGDQLALSNLTVTSGNGEIVGDDIGYEFRPADDFNGVVTFGYDVSDGEFTVAGSATLNVTAVNDAPEAQNDAVTVSEDGVSSIATATLLDNDTDVDGDTLQIVSVDRSGLSGQLIGDGVTTPNFSYIASASAQALDDGESLTESFSYTVADADGEESTATVEITIEGANDTPVAGAPVGLGSVNEFDTQTIQIASLLSNASDVDASDVLTASNFSAAGGDVEDNGDGTLTFTAGEVGVDGGMGTISFDISDGTETVDGTGIISILDVPDAPNTAPVAVDDGSPFIIDASPDQIIFISEEGGSIDVLANDSDADGDELFITEIEDVFGLETSIAPDGKSVFVRSVANGELSPFDLIEIDYTITDGQETSTATINAFLDFGGPIIVFGGDEFLT